ncbi:FG-GAP repeat domain-containing protein [Actinoplanes sp. NPDC049599]|uniref:FG-GAP repeat domain-containing protein n=1 Tax=Actinoplanes sp. NPDC049599 TaxID=3363903 RepID=UPI003796AF9C
MVIAIVLTSAATTVAAVTPAQAQRFIMPDFGTDQGWQGARHPRLVVDITGDRRADVVGFGDTGVHTAVATSDGQFAASFQVSNDFAYDTGWRVEQHDRFVTDITGDGRADIVGVSGEGVFTAVAIGGGWFGPKKQVAPGLSKATCTISKLADANGDGRNDLFCMRDARVEVALALGDGGFAARKPVTTVFPVHDILGRTTTFNVVDVTRDGRADILGTITSNQGVVPQFLTLTSLGNGDYAAEEDGGAAFAMGASVVPDAIIDVSGDGFADLIKFTDATRVARGRGDGTFAAFLGAIADFGFPTGWNPTSHLRLAADINADGRGDVVGFGNPGVFTAAGRTNGTFEAPVRFASADFGRSSGWEVVDHPRFLADITGDGRPDIVGFKQAGMYTAVNQDGFFG